MPKISSEGSPSIRAKAGANTVEPLSLDDIPIPAFERKGEVGSVTRAMHCLAQIEARIEVIASLNLQPHPGLLARRAQIIATLESQNSDTSLEAARRDLIRQLRRSGRTVTEMEPSDTNEFEVTFPPPRMIHKENSKKG